MKSGIPLRSLALGLLLALLFVTNPARAEKYAEADFSDQTPGPLAATATLQPWVGPPAAGVRGRIEIAAPPVVTPGAPNLKTVLVFYSSGEAASPTATPPLLNVKVPGFGTAGTKGSCLIRFLIPEAGDGQTLFHLGGIWKGNAGDLLLKKGHVFLVTGKTNLEVGLYAVDKWCELRADFDFVQKTFSLFLNGEQIGNALPWNDPKAQAIELMGITSNVQAVAAGTPVLCLQKIEVSSDGAKN